MKAMLWSCSVLLVASLAITATESRTITKREAAIDPHAQPVDNDAYRDKRYVEHKYGVKNAILGFVFNKINSFIDSKTAWIDQLDKTNIAKNKAHGIEPPQDPVVSLSGIISGPPKGFAWETTTTPKGPTTTEDIVIFEKGKPVSLDVPDQLFGSSFTLVTNLSNTVGDFMINSALRAQRLLESMRPFLRWAFGAKGIVIEATTDKPIFSDPNAT